MANGYIGGSVTAEIILDAAQFNEAVSKVKEEVEVLNSTFNKLNGSKVNKTVSSLKKDVASLKREISSLKQQLRTLQNSGKGTGNAFNSMGNNAAKARNQFKFLSETLKQGNANLNTYKANMNQINQALARQSAEATKNANAVRQAGRGLTSFNNGVVQTAHSGRILSNTLYQIRGALLSLKMIFTAMGGMALWGFATQLAEGVKETFTAKNEMEAQLKQNSKVGSGGIAYFNKALDSTVDKFKKINKYSIGETVSAIGLEFDLSAKQMAESLDIVAMVQSEYVRAGRKESEAALAVKDILQGEFSRLSRETGVGKEDLQAYGWNGDKKDVESLMKALRKAATDRHWDIFAAKATSLNDVMTIMKSRFSETGADLLQSATPLIVGAFNAMIDVFDSFQKGFNNLSPFWQNVGIWSTLAGGILGVGTALPMIFKGMGLADIATIGWSKSLATAALNLNKAEVAQYGFRKALAAVITGTSASELSTIRTTKAIMGRILGVKQATLAEHGYLTALVKSRLELSTIGPVMSDASIASLKWYQKLGFLSGGLKESEMATAGLGRSLLKTATSAKVLKAAFLGLMAVNVIVWLAGIAAWCDTVKKNVDEFNNVAENGKELLEDASKTVSDYEQSLSKLDKTTETYARTKANLDQATANKKDLEAAVKLTEEYKKQNEQAEKDMRLEHQRQLRESYRLAGKDMKAATELASGYEEKVKAGQKAIEHSYDVYKDRLYKSSQHVNEHVAQLKEAGVQGQALIDYIDEYNIEAENAAELWKKFNQGDMASGAYALLSELKLAWIDISHHPEVVTLMQNLGETWKGLQPTLKSITEDLKWLGLRLAETANWLLSSDIGKAIATWGAFGVVAGGVGLKLYHVLGGTKSVIDIFKTLFGKLKEGVGKWRDYGDEAEKANKKAGGTTPTTTGGTVPGKGSEDATFKETLGKQLKNDAIKYARAAAFIAAAMLLVTEAIVLVQAPMWGLAEVGKTFKAKETSIRAGIEGLQVIAPVMAIFLPPVIALMLITEKYAPQFDIIPAFMSSAELIAMGMLLVGEAVFMMVAPMLAIAAVGYVKQALGNGVEQGKQAIQLVTDTLTGLYPIIPVFIAAIALGAIGVFSEGIGFVAEVAIIASGMAMIAVAVASLILPLEAIKLLGNQATDLEGVQRGAEVIKQCAEALVYVEQAVSTMALVKWELLAGNLADVIAAITGHNLGDDLVKLAEEGGFLSKMNDFAKAFNNLEFTPVNADKAAALQTAAESLTAINTALEATKNAINNLPQEFKTGGEELNSVFTSYNQDTDKFSGSLSGDSSTGYFDQLKQPLKELKKFVDEFNGEEFAIAEIDQGRIDAINSAADMVTQANAAIEKVKTAMGGVADAGWNQNMATGGVFAAVSGWLGGLTAGTSGGAAGSGGYTSSLGSSLQEMENVIKDLMTFNSNIASLGAGGGSSEGGANVEALSGMVTAVSDAINQLNSTLSGAVPTIKSNALGMGTAIKDGIKQGMGDLTSVVVPPLTTAMTSMRNYAGTYGKGVGWQGTQGFKSEFKIKDAVSEELGYALAEMDGKKQEFYDKGYALGNAAAQGFKDGDDSHSPGIMARTIFAELDYIGDAMVEAVPVFYDKAYALGETIGNSFNPSLGLGGLSVDELSQFQVGLDQVSSMANTTDMQTSMAFNNMNMNVGTSMQGMTTSVNGAFTNIQTNTNNKYSQLVNTTRVSLNTMQNQTTKNIGAIKTSWRGMQNALIASAEHIRTQTSQKIRSLQSNMASFWQKVQNPALLLGGAGGSNMGSRISNASSPKVYSPSQSSKPRHAAGGLLSPKKSAIPRSRPKHNNNTKDLRLKNVIGEYLECLMNGGICAAGSGWNFNWSPDIQQALLKWHTHFGQIYDDVLTVGKFENDDFPVRGNATIAKRYIFDAIRQTSYDFYWDSHYSPLEAWNRKKFNCVDGAKLAIAFANAFGFGGGSIQYGSWNGTGHGFAVIPGLGVIDATAIQQRGSFTAPGTVTGYPAAGSRPRYTPRRDSNQGNNYDYSGMNIEIHVHGNDVSVNDQQIDSQTGRKLIDLLGINPSTGR